MGFRVDPTTGLSTSEPQRGLSHGLRRSKPTDRQHHRGVVWTPSRQGHRIDRSPAGNSAYGTSIARVLAAKVLHHRRTAAS